MKMLEVCLSTDYYQHQTNNTNGVGAQSAHWEALHGLRIMVSLDGEVNLAQLVGWNVWSCTQPRRFKTPLRLNLGAYFLFLMIMINENSPSSS